MQAFYPGGFSSFGMDPRNFNAMFSEMVEPMATFSTQITNAPSEIKKTGPRPIMPRVDCCDTDECFCVWVDLCVVRRKMFQLLLLMVSFILKQPKRSVPPLRTSPVRTRTG